ncbi:IS110 family transposase [Pedobacter jeongneungensis]|uniref:IS110 family transposase n=1 Tax=Pedobacter jeongneungensis TaxID=947309 RepID=UPI0009FB9F52|nr:IS110 family transposase [Pedobacter jeongneungensis]
MMREKKLAPVKYFIGIDVSKATFNYCVKSGSGKVVNGKAANNSESIREFFSGLKQIPGFKTGFAVFGMETTGIYGNILIGTLSKLKAKIVVEPALRIKNSLGLIKGKNDKLDAARIARYLVKNLSELRLWVPRRKIIDQLSSLSTLRERMVKVRTIIQTPLDEDNGFIDQAVSEENLRLCSPSVSKVVQLIKEVDERIKQIWSSDEQTCRMMKIMLSVVGIGEVTALEMLIQTNEFKSISTARTFASYCGIAPFEHDSGTSVKKPARVSKMANNRVKSLLHNGVRTCLANDHEIKAYYKRRVVVDKKKKSSAINAIKFKLICRVFACIRGNRLYDRHYVPKKAIREISTEK